MKARLLQLQVAELLLVFEVSLELDHGGAERGMVAVEGVLKFAAALGVERHFERGDAARTPGSVGERLDELGSRRPAGEYSALVLYTAVLIVDRNIDLANYSYSVGLKNTVAKLNFQEYHFAGEYAFFRRVSALVDIPVRTISPTVSFLCVPECTASSQLQTVLPTQNQGFTGLSDVRAGAKFGLLNRPGTQLTFQLSTSFPTGNTAHGLGTGHNTIEPFLLYAQRLGPRLDIFGEIGDTHLIGGAQSFVYDPQRSPAQQSFAGDVVNYGVGASYSLSQGSRVRFAPVVELVGWKVTGGLTTIVAGDAAGQPLAYVLPAGTPPGYGSNIVNLKA